MKNAIVYKAELPAAADLETHLKERPWRPIASFEAKRHAFWAAEGEPLVKTFPGGYAICLRTDAKVMPGKVIKAMAEEEIAHREKAQDRKLSKQERTIIKEEITEGVMADALVKQDYTWAYYHQAGGYLFVDTASKSTADAVMGELIQACESVKTVTIHVSELRHGLTSRLKQACEGMEDTAFGPFFIGQDLRLVRKAADSPMERVTYSECDITSNEVMQQLEAQFRVESIELGMKGVSFHLTSEFRLKGFDWTDVEAAEEEDDAWEHETGTKVALAAGIIDDLCELVGYEPPALEEGDDAGTGA